MAKAKAEAEAEAEAEAARRRQLGKTLQATRWTYSGVAAVVERAGGARRGRTWVHGSHGWRQTETSWERWEQIRGDRQVGPTPYRSEVCAHAKSIEFVRFILYGRSHPEFPAWHFIGPFECSQMP